MNVLVLILLLLIPLLSYLIICNKLGSIYPFNKDKGAILASQNDLRRHIALRVYRYTQLGKFEKTITLFAICCYLLSDFVVNLIRYRFKYYDKRGILYRDFWFLVCFIGSIVIYNSTSPFYWLAYLWFVWRITAIFLSTLIYNYGDV
jgi:hypothetical protein